MQKLFPATSLPRPVPTDEYLPRTFGFALGARRGFFPPRIEQQGF